MALLYLATKPALMGVDVDRLAYPYTILRPVVVRRGDMPLARRCPIPSLQWGSGAFLVDVKPPGSDIWWSIDHVDDSVTESYMEEIVFYREHAYPFSKPSWRLGMYP
jgi:hypothetical protein